MAGSPLKRYFPRGRCEGTNVRGTRCGSQKVYLTKSGAKKCRFHGGAHYHRIAMNKPIVYTGPRTEEGKRRAISNLLQGKHRREDFGANDSKAFKVAA